MSALNQRIDLVERVEPFRPLLYDQRFDDALASMVAPPYDLIGPERQAQLYGRSPFNVVRLELNRDADRYESSARLLADWLREGVLVRADKPAIYLYTQKFRHQGRTLSRIGLVARFRLEEFSRGRILPHERTFPAAKIDRLRLLEATRTNLSSIFGLYSGAHPELDLLRIDVARRAPIRQVTDDLGIDNELRAIEAPDEIATVQRALDSSRVLIADGHHRYETALEYRRQMRAAEGNPAGFKPYDYVMMTLVACDDPGLVILPTHRLVRRLLREAIESFVARARELFVVEPFADRAEFRTRLAEAGRGALGVALAGHDALYIIRLRDPAAITVQAIPEPVRQLDVSILHRLVLQPIFGLDADAIKAGGNIEYTIDAAGALEAVASGRADGAFLMNPPSIADVIRVSDAGATMPEKSTYFYPKLLTGLLMNPLFD
jgi:uncharacterized protein (DUF1015 family)